MEFKATGSYVSVRDALEILEQHVLLLLQQHHLPSFETVNLLHSYKRVLAEDIISAVNVPAYDSSHMDGYAVKAEDIIHASQQNPVILELRKNQIKPTTIVFKFFLQKGEAFRIMTGGYLPRGANTIVPIEQTQLINKNQVQVISALPKGSFVYARGRDIKKGRRLMKSGKILRPQDIALLALLKVSKVNVFDKPKVAIIATGNELTSQLQNVKSRKIPDTHSHIISTMVEELGGLAFRMGITPDDISKIRNKIETAILNRMDLILTLGGSSVGEYDLVESAIKSIGSPAVLLHGVKLDRGRVTGLAIIKGKPIIIMPGPIQGALNAFMIFGRPILKLLSGQSKGRPLTIASTFTGEWYARKKFSDFTKVIYVKLTNQQNGEFIAMPMSGETESMTILTRSNGYIIADEKKTHIRSGEKVKVHLLPGLSYANDQLEV
jgi:molybdenum cofactor synthesis domain-containing protein